MAMPSPDASWRDSARFPQFFFVDSRAVFPVFLFLINIQWWTLILSIAVMIFFSVLLRYGFTLGTFIRFVRSYIAGPRKMARPWWVYGYY